MYGSASSLVFERAEGEGHHSALLGRAQCSTAYSVKLDAMFRSALNRIAEHPKLGRPTNDPETRVKVVGDFEIFYSFTTDAAHILSVWHSRRDPADRRY